MQVRSSLKEIRAKQGLALFGLAARSGVSTSTLSAIERWGYLPSRSLRERIAVALGVDERDIWTELKATTEVRSDALA